jgi:hypothetical protein
MVVESRFADAEHMSLARKLLLAMFLVSLTGTAFGAGTFASFNATTTNAASTFATGSLILSNKVGGGAATACYSSGGTGTFTNGNANSNCSALFTATTANVPGNSATVALELKNEGNVSGGSGIKGSASSCTAGDAVGGGATNTAYHGNGDPCSYIQVKVQETQSDYTTAVRCLYDASGTNPTTCGTGGTATAFATFTQSTPMAVATGAAIPSGTSKYVVMTLFFPNGTAGLENQYMGRYLSFSTTWTLTQ